jgi:hypothetical protein
VSALSVAGLSTGLLPERSLFAFVPVAVSVKSLTVLVPPLSFTTFLIKCSFGAMSLFVIVQTASSPSPRLTELPDTGAPPFLTQLQALAV